MSVKVRPIEIDESSTSTAVAITAPKRSKLQPDYSKALPSLFKVFFLQLKDQMENANVWNTEDRKEILKKAQPIVLQSHFFRFMDGVKRGIIPFTLDQLLYINLELNEYNKANPDESLVAINKAIELCMRFLMRQAGWKTQDLTKVTQTLYALHDAIFGDQKTTPVLLQIDKMHAVANLSEKSQVFMDTVMVDDFDEIRRSIKKKVQNENGVFDLTDEEILVIAKIADRFYKNKEKTSYLGMSRNVDQLPGARAFTAVDGMAEFRQNTIATKYIYMRNFRKRILSCFSEARVSRKEITYENQTYIVSFAIHKQKIERKDGNEDGKKNEIKLVKAITISKASDDTDENDIDNSDRDVCLFVEAFDEETPQRKPNPDLSFADLPLYKLELVPSSHGVRLKKVPEALRQLIVAKMIKHGWESTRFTAIWHQKELKLVDISWEIGNMLDRSGLYGEILTYVTGLDSKEYSAVAKTRLKLVYIAAYVLTTEEHLSTWNRNEFFKRPHTPQNGTTLQERIKTATLAVINKHKHPFKWLNKSIFTVDYEDPSQIKTYTTTDEDEAAPNVLSLEECLEVLKPVLADQAPIAGVLAVIDTMALGIERILKNPKEKEVVSALNLCFTPYAGFPMSKINDVVDDRVKNSRQKANILLSLLLKLNATELKASEDQYTKIQDFLSNE